MNIFRVDLPVANFAAFHAESKICFRRRAEIERADRHRKKRAMMKWFVSVF